MGVEKGMARLDDGMEVHREMVVHPGGVGIVPVLDEGVLLIRQYRIAVQRHVLEIPAGRLEGNEDPEHRGRCELEEECGYRAGRLELVVRFIVKGIYRLSYVFSI